MEKSGKKNQADAKEVMAKKPTKKEVAEITAMLNYLRMSPKKVRLVTNFLPGNEVEKALNYLRFVNKAAVRPLVKLINSAVANAEHNFGFMVKDLFIKTIIVNDGPFLKRWQPKAYGRAGMIRKRSSHIKLILGVSPGAKKKTVKQETEQMTKNQAAVAEKEVKPEEKKTEKPKTFQKGRDQSFKERKGFLKKFFQRKTG